MRLQEQLHEAGSSLHGCLHPAQGCEPQMCGYGGQRWNPKNWGKNPGFQSITHRRRSAERGSWELTALGSSCVKQTLLTLPSKLVTPSDLPRLSCQTRGFCPTMGSHHIPTAQHELPRANGNKDSNVSYYSSCA